MAFRRVHRHQLGGLTPLEFRNGDLVAGFRFHGEETAPQQGHPDQGLSFDYHRYRAHWPTVSTSSEVSFSRRRRFLRWRAA